MHTDVRTCMGSCLRLWQSLVQGSLRSGCSHHTHLGKARIWHLPGERRAGQAWGGNRACKSR